MNRYLTATILAMIAVAAGQAQVMQQAPRLVVSIAIDQLRGDYMEQFAPLYSQDGFRRMLQEGRVYDGGGFSFSPVDRASAIASIATGTTPYYNSIVGQQWLDRNTLQRVFCVDDTRYAGIFTSDSSSPEQLATSTLGDELKVSTQGAAIVYGVAPWRDAAILSAGHAADGAVWADARTGKWCTSRYYFQKDMPSWLKAYNDLHTLSAKGLNNTVVADIALQCLQSTAMGKDAVTDMLNVVMDGSFTIPRDPAKRNQAIESAYVKLDKDLARLIMGIEQRVGKDNVLFVMTSCGYNDEPTTDYSPYRIPTGTFYINRTANLLNIYLSAIYGQGRYVETTFRNQIFLNHKLIEQKRISHSDLLSRSQAFLVQCAGVRDVFTSEQMLTRGSFDGPQRNGYYQNNCGDILIEVAPGWQLENEDTGENFTSRMGIVQFPIVFLGAGIEPARIASQVSAEHIAPTIAKAIRIRAPNACNASPLF